MADDRSSEKARERAIKQAHQILADYWNSGIGQAREAWERGDTLFEMVVPAVSTARTAASLLAGSVETQRTESSARELLTAVEAGGWRLEHASYVWEQTGAISRDKFMSSGQVEEVTGQVLGFYLFRRVDGAEVDYTAPPEVLEQVRFLEAATGQRSVRFPEVRSASS